MSVLRLKRAILAGGVALLLGASALGLAFAQEPATPTPAPSERPSPPMARYQAFLDALARRLGVSSERLQQAIDEARAEVGVPEGAMKPFFGHGRRGLRLAHLDLSVAAQAIGISIEQLRQELPGKSLAQVAQEHGKDPNAVATALKDALGQRIDEAVAAGKLTQEQAAQLKEKATRHVDQLMNRVMPQRAKGARWWKSTAPATPTATS
mgnify:CR=1 FL=1